ncbi:MAG: NTP transferase domain-containing protein [Parcubacteria group bacterium]|nr:NTP transferase domain-containing protein [Parcubacteria group bacterium]
MRRNRLTITLRNDLLKLLDGTIDGAEIRNRSHAIERLLGKALYPRVTKAVVLAAGEGVKMRPFTYEMPKTMLPVKGRPILEHAIELLRSHELRDIVIVIGRLGEKIRAHFSDGKHFGVTITYVEQSAKPIGTAAALLAAKPYVGSGPVLVMYGDVLADINLAEFIEFHRNEKGVATMALTSVADPSIYGAVGLAGTRVCEITEKPTKSNTTSRVINAGIYVFEPEALGALSKDAVSLERDLFPALCKEGKLMGYPFAGKWFDIGTPAIYERALNEWKQSSKQ